MGILDLQKMTSPEVRQAIDAGHDTIVIPFGSLEQHGGHLPIGTDAMLVEAVEQCRSIEGASVVTVASDFSRDVLRDGTVGVSMKFDITPEESGAHAGEWETSIMLHLAPELVHMDAAAPGYVGDMAEGVQRVLRDGVSLDELAANGVMGDPRKAEAERGQHYIEALTNVALRVLEHP